MEWLVAVIGVAGALGGVWLGNELSIRSTRADKDLDLKRTAYGAILAELSLIDSVLKVADGYIEENAARYFHEDLSGQHDALIGDRMRDIRSKLARDYLVLSEIFISQIEAMFAEIEARDGDRVSDHFVFRDAIYKHRPKLLSIARAEVGISGRRVAPAQ